MNIGQFEVKNKVVISDPCYDKDNGCNITTPVKKGTWNARVEVSDEGEWGNRVKNLFVCHDDYEYLNCDFIGWAFLGECGVDSGQLGVFAEEIYKNDDAECLNNIKKSDICEDEKFYNRMCYLTHDDGTEERQFGSFEQGVNTSTGYGDGCYLVRTIKKDDVIVAIWINFISDDDDDDDEYSYEDEDNEDDE